MVMIEQKRNELEEFIREQILGPGALGYRFIDISNKKVLEDNISEKKPLNYSNELINNAPGALYSTGILFPVDDSESAVLETDPDSPSTDENKDNGISGTHENVGDDIEDEEVLNLNQMYPNTMGLTCCLQDKISQSGDITIKVSARYYKKLDTTNLGNMYGLLLDNDPKAFRLFLEEFDEEEPLRAKLRIKEFGKNTLLFFHDLKTEEIGSIKKNLGDINRKKTAELGSEWENQYLNGYKEFLFRKLKYDIINKKEQKEVAYRIEKIESIENSIAHINDLLNIFDTRGYGLWKCELLEKEITLPGSIPKNIKGKKVYNYNNFEELKDIFKIDLDNNAKAALSINFQLSKDSRKKDSGLFLKVQLVNTSTHFTVSEDDSRYYSVFNEIVNQRAFFGVKIKVVSKYLTPYRDFDTQKEKDTFSEDEISRFIYRQYKDYAVGHGCSVKWNDDSSDRKSVETEYIPSFDTPDVDPIPKDKSSIVEENRSYVPEKVFKNTTCLQFKWLSTFSNATDEAVVEQLLSFVNSYENWIKDKRSKYKFGDESKIAEQELSKCEKDKDRMLRNIRQILSGEENERNMNSFRLMNSAMFMQLWHSVKVKNDKLPNILKDPSFHSFDIEFYKNTTDNLFQENVPAAWRPFQLAFILLNLDGIFQRSDDEKWKLRNNLVDLVWFPTGGGKTEAYLGIIALTIINRRKTHGDRGGGTAILMRYTLRLLTLQQFQRATVLIMALELMRRWNEYGLGNEPISIGLWVGMSSLPNNLKDLQGEYEKIRGLQHEGATNISSKIPFENCPWCGHKLNPISFEWIKDRQEVYMYNRILLRCSRPDHKCSFSSPLRPKNQRFDHGPIPISLSDEEIYQHPPTLLFGTVDKFAQLAHKVSGDKQKRHQDSRRLFGKGNWETGKPSDGYLTPDLIIQDELHLLLGPLGSSVALFESAIDQLCTRKKDGLSIRPKVISSTATTRNTELQIMALFDRKVNLFPKPGVECDDSFFAFYKREFRDKKGNEVDYLSKRKYLGILPTGRTQMWMQMRLTAILITHRAVFEIDQLKESGPLSDSVYGHEFIKAMDYYHTMVSYFNSLREVGKTESQIHTYILKEIRRVFNRVVRPGKLMQGLYTYSILEGELTGRLSGEGVKKELDRVSTKWSPQKRFAHLDEQGNKIRGTTPPDVVVATNMISVGIDISRFNSIIMNSMPRNIAEYIQASSRVARDGHGLVLTVHHPFRARDISHYEKFIEFHEKMYSYVEPISITPFTQKAISRYLGLYVATMLRHKTDFVERNSASRILQLKDNEIEDIRVQLTKYFEIRKKELANRDVSDLIKNLLREENLDDIKKWVKEAIEEWEDRYEEVLSDGENLVFNYKAKNATPPQRQLYVDIDEYEANIHSHKWQIPQSLRVIEPEAAIKIMPK